MRRIFLILLSLVAIISCSENLQEEKKSVYSDGAETLFTKVSAETSSINFRNFIRQTEEFNFLNYEYIYGGAGVAVIDYNLDGLQDLYLVSNFDANKLYKNLGDFKFEDVTASTKTEDANEFSTGVSVIDVNSDGWPDLYICKAGSLNNPEGRRNLVFVNQKDGTFKEEGAKWGLDHPGFSVQVYPFDYDHDGDKDLYLVNYRPDFENVSTINDQLQLDVQDESSDQLFRNDGDHFTNVTAELGLMNKMWGMSAVISDFNDDGWEDIYVCNDFSEPDFLYINLGGGKFSNQIISRLQHITFFSMGSDYADLNNDLNSDLMTVDMLSDNYARSKENMASMNTETFRSLVKIGYHHGYMANMLHINKGYGLFEETGQLSGVTKSDWSWAPLIADLDNDGLKDIYITNGVERDYNNQDTRTKVTKILSDGEPIVIEDLLAMYPSEPIMNHVYKNLGNLSFSKHMEEWGLTDKTISNGAAYVDLDNDGDLDLISQNINDEVGIYKNNSNKNYLDVSLKGPAKNPMAIGSKVYVTSSSTTQLNELYLSRGYRSSVTNVLHFGLGEEDAVEKLIVKWPDGKTSILTNLDANQKITVDYATATDAETGIKNIPWAKKVTNMVELGVDYTHRENEYDDFTKQLLLPQQQSTKGTGIIVADVNGDGLDDFYIGNAKGAAAELYVQQAGGKFKKSNESLWKNEAKYEDANALFFDADGDGDQDLYVVSAGYEMSPDSPLLQDRLYFNDGKGNFSFKKDALPKMLTSGKSIAVADYDKDGDLDLFIGGNVVPAKYPVTPRSYLLNNKNGKFTDVLTNDASLAMIGMVSDAVFTDYDTDGELDLMVVGEWMAPTVFVNTNGAFEKSQSITGLENTEGWWFSVSAADFDGDGDDDYILGNLGENNKFHPTKDKPLYIYAKDFDNNGSFDVALSKINEGKLVPVRGKECSSQQNPFLLDKIKTYKEFATLEMKDIYGEDELSDALKLSASMFESVYVENLGNGAFRVQKLPHEAQQGPTLATFIEDINNDGNLDIMAIGAIYDTEVETIRYDGSFGYVLLGDGKGGFKHSKTYEPIIVSDSKDITQITLNGKKHFMVVSNNAPLEMFTFGP